MTQELVLGRDPRKVLDEAGPLALQQALIIGLQICDALVCAHARSIVHRDIKPGNILLDERGFVKITDFGLAVALLPENDGDEATLPTLIAGTPGYMAPEQITGERVDARTDIFALGCVIHKMLSGRHPFEGDTTSGVIQRTLQDLPTMPSQFRTDLPPAVHQIVARACSKDPNSRCENAAHLGRELLGCRGHLDRALQQQVAREYGLGWAEDAARPPAHSVTAISLARGATARASSSGKQPSGEHAGF
jgi:serine/threonine-protein kinase